MTETLLEKYQPLAQEMAEIYIDNMELELGKKYINTMYDCNATLSNQQYSDLRAKHDVEHNEFADLYAEFQKMKPTQHLSMTMDAFHASGGAVDIEPAYNSSSGRVNVAVKFSMKEHQLESLEGLSKLEQNFLTMNAMLQVEKVLADADPNGAPVF